MWFVCFSQVIQLAVYGSQRLPVLHSGLSCLNLQVFWYILIIVLLVEGLIVVVGQCEVYISYASSNSGLSQYVFTISLCCG